MNVAVRYYTRSGNTKKLADAIAKAVQAEALTVDEPLAEKADVLFLGSSVYAGGYDRSVKDFLTNNKDKIGRIYNFSTAAFPTSTYDKVKKLAEEIGVDISDKEFSCRGSFLIMNRNRPNEDDLKAAAEFAGKAISENG